MTGTSVQFDASPWGGGAVLCHNFVPISFIRMAWTKRWADRLGCTIGEPHGQTTWEFLTLLLAMLQWGTAYKDIGIAIVGDNTAALSAALSFKGRGGLTILTREFSWRKVRHRWRLATGHLPAEANTVADALSRLCAPAGHESKAFPEALVGVKEETPATYERVFALDAM